VPNGDADTGIVKDTDLARRRGFSHHERLQGSVGRGLLCSPQASLGGGRFFRTEAPKKKKEIGCCSEGSCSSSQWFFYRRVVDALDGMR
jgi:hypothetical protein